ncbi:LppP/LprE family lipoprotein [Amycolatopsis sp. NPDC004378]
MNRTFANPPWARAGLIVGGLLVTVAPLLPWVSVVLLGDFSLVRAAAPVVSIAISVFGATGLVCGALVRSPTAARAVGVTFGIVTGAAVVLLMVVAARMVSPLQPLAGISWGPWVALGGSIAALIAAAVPGSRPTAPARPAAVMLAVSVVVISGAAVGIVVWQADSTSTSAAGASTAAPVSPEEATPTTTQSAGIHLLPVFPATSVGAPGSGPDPGAPDPVAQAAEAVVQAHGYTPSAAVRWSGGNTLNAITATATGSADGYDQRVFFFHDGAYIGTDARLPSAEVSEAWSTGDTIALTYQLYNPDDPACCPTAGSALVRFHWFGTELRPLDPIPTAAQNSPRSRR